jgi:hypothetical protein
MDEAVNDRPRPQGRVEARFRGLFPEQRIVLVDDIDDIAATFDGLEDQRPATCGAYSLSYILPPLGFTRHFGNDLGAEDYLAHLAGVVIESHEIGPSDVVSRLVAAGEVGEEEASLRYGRTWYRYPVRHSDDDAVTGTSVVGLTRAISLGTEGALASLPIPARLPDGSVQLTHERWTSLLQMLAEHVSDWQWHAILNYETSQLLRPDDPSFTPQNLRLPDPTVAIPLDSWNVGHFAGLAGLWRSVTGQWWLLLLDSYKERGFDGYQPQPAELMRRGLVREDGRGGGMLLVLRAEVLRAVAAEIEGLDLVPSTWSNGSTPPEDWQWEMGL